MRLTKFILKTSVCIELIGAALLLPAFIRDFGITNERYGDKRNKISAGKNNGRLKEKKDEICFTYRAWKVWQTHCNEA